MKFSTASKVWSAALLCATLSGVSTGAQAGESQNSIFGNVEPALRDRMFFRLSYVSANVKTTSKDTYDVSGPLMTRADIASLRDDADGFSQSAYFYNASQDPLSYNNATNGLTTALDNQLTASGCASYAAGLGTPCGVKGRGANRLSTVALSVGYFLDEAYSWALEAFVLAAPLAASVYGDGANSLNGKKIIETKLLPPMVTLSHYFGDAKDSLRPYLGLTASYAIFFDSRATNTMNAYAGGRSAGDTTVKVNNAFGLGPVVGFKYQPQASDWYMSMSLGKVRFSTEATIITHNTTITSTSDALGDYGAYIDAALRASSAYRGANSIRVKTTGGPLGYTADQVVPLVDAMMCDLAKKKFLNDSCNLGTGVRKATTVLDNTLFVFSVGHNF